MDKIEQLTAANKNYINTEPLLLKKYDGGRIHIILFPPLEQEILYLPYTPYTLNMILIRPNYAFTKLRE
jgi:hypothetical protein